MARPRTYKTQGIVLRQMPLGEADRILTLFTPDVGKLRAVARGVRRTKSRLGGHVEPLCHVRVSVAEGRALDTIVEAETIHSFRGLREDLQEVSAAVYITELVDRFTVEQSPNPTLFQHLLDALTWLQRVERPEKLLRHFEVRLLADAGFGPELQRCVECRSDLEPGDHVYSSAKGGVVCPACRVNIDESVLPISLNAIKVLRFLQREDYARTDALDVPDALLVQVERLLRTYVRYVLERDLSSVEFMSQAAAAGR